MPQPLKPYVVAIDPGVHTGVGVWSRKTGKVIAWCERDFFSVQEYLATTFASRDEVKVFVEHPPKFVYGRNKQLAGGERDNYTVDVGGNRREAQLLAETLRRQGYDVELVSPVREAKWDAKRFRLFTGSTAATSQHIRDAVRLAVYYADKRSER